MDVKSLKKKFESPPGKTTWAPTGNSGDHVGTGKFEKVEGDPPKPRGPPPKKSLSDLP